MVDISELVNSRRNLIRELKSVADDFASVERTQLTRPELGELRFIELDEEFQVLSDTARRLHTLRLDDLPGDLARRGLDAFGAVKQRLLHIQAFGVRNFTDYGNNPVDAHRALVEATRVSIKAFYDSIAPVVGFAAGLGMASQAEDVALQAENARQALATALEEAQRNSAAIAELLTLGQENLQQVAIKRHATDFATEALQQQAAGRKWLTATAWLAVATTMFAFANVYSAVFRPSNVDSAVLTQLVVAKVIAFSILISATVWCGRAYRAARHNEIVNRHRQNALASFEAFAAATEDLSTRNTVLVQATQAIFAPQPSGYAESAQDGTSGSSLAELVRAARAFGRPA